MTHCDFSARRARDEMRHIIGSSEPDVIIGCDKDQNRRCRKRVKDHMEFLCELCEAHVAGGRYFVHELMREQLWRISACLGFGSYGEGGPGFLNASVRTVTNARQVGVRMQSEYSPHKREHGTNRNMDT